MWRVHLCLIYVTAALTGGAFAMTLTGLLERRQEQLAAEHRAAWNRQQEATRAASDKQRALCRVLVLPARE